MMKAMHLSESKWIRPQRLLICDKLFRRAWLVSRLDGKLSRSSTKKKNVNQEIIQIIDMEHVLNRTLLFCGSTTNQY